MTTKKMLIWKMMKTKLTVAKPSIDHEQLAIAQPEAAWVVLESVCAVTSHDVDEKDALSIATSPVKRALVSRKHVVTPIETAHVLLAATGLSDPDLQLIDVTVPLAT